MVQLGTNPAPLAHKMPLVAKSTAVSSASPVTSKGTIKIGGKLTGKLGDSAISTPVSFAPCTAIAPEQASSSSVSNSTVQECAPVEVAAEMPATELSTVPAPPLSQS